MAEIVTESAEAHNYSAEVVTTAEVHNFRQTVRKKKLIPGIISVPEIYDWLMNG